MTNLTERNSLWVQVEASESMKLYLQRKYSKQKEYEQHIKEYETLQKYIRIKDKIIVLSFTQQSWAGIVEYNKDDIIFEENVIKRKIKNKTEILSTLNYKESKGIFKKIHENVTLKYVVFKNNSMFYNAFYKLIEKYHTSKKEVKNLKLSELQRVKVINI